MEEPKREKTEEDKARLKEERRARKKARKLDTRASKRGMTPAALEKEDIARRLREAEDLPPPSKRVKRTREEDEEKVRCPLFEFDPSRGFRAPSLSILRLI